MLKPECIEIFAIMRQSVKYSITTIPIVIMISVTTS